MPIRFGLSAALVTPFDADGSIDAVRVVRQSRACLAGGCRSVTLFGTTGEGASVGRKDQAQVLDAALAASIPAEQIVLGVLLNAATDAAEHIALAHDRGLRNVLLAPPSYFKTLGEDGCFAWFATVFALAGEKARNVILYHIPSVTMVELSPALIGRLKTAFPNAVTGVKDSGGVWSYSEALLTQHSDLMILIGNERELARAVRMGAQGAISGMANFMPGIVRRLAEEGLDDERVGAIMDGFGSLPVTPAVKTLTAVHTGDRSWLNVAPPLQALTGGDIDRLTDLYGRVLGSRA